MEIIFPNRPATLKMKSVKAGCESSPAGPKREAALRHYQTAETAHLAHREADCNRELDAASNALT